MNKENQRQVALNQAFESLDEAIKKSWWLIATGLTLLFLAGGILIFNHLTGFVSDAKLTTELNYLSLVLALIGALLLIISDYKVHRASIVLRRIKKGR